MLRKRPPQTKKSSDDPEKDPEVKIDEAAAEGESEKSGKNRPLLRKVWYGVAAFLIFGLILTALVTAAYLLTLQSCTSANTRLAKNSAVATIIFATLALIADIGFIVLQIRRKHKGKKEEKQSSKKKKGSKKSKEKSEKENEIEADEVEEGESSEIQVTKTDSAFNESGKKDSDVNLDPKALQQLLQDMTLTFA